MKRLLSFCLAASFFASPLGLQATTLPDTTAQALAKLQWRSIGPYIGGRVVAVAGVPNNPNLFYMGGVEGGIWRSTNYGITWVNISDDSLPLNASSIGALAVAPSNPKVIYAGTGEADIRADLDTGAGIFKSSDAGKTWHYAGLGDTHSTMALQVDPRDSNVVYAASMGHVFKPNAMRGVFKTTDGGKSWNRILFVDDKTGAVDISMDQHNPNVLYAAMWEAQRLPWGLIGAGPGSGLYKSTDGGAHWKNLSQTPGFPTGTLGKIGVSVSPADPRVVYAIVEARNGGVFRSDDGGESWKHVNNEMKLRQRAFYYTAILADPVNPRIAYVPNVDNYFKTTDGGTTWKSITDTAPHGDHHIIWVNPHNTKILLEGDDGGATISTDGGESWSPQDNQPTGQFYKVALDDQFPVHAYGAQQDESSIEGPTASIFGGIGRDAWHPVASGESTWVAPDPDSNDVTYGSGYFSSLARYNNKNGELHNVTPYPRYMSGDPASEEAYRFGWTHPIFFSPANPNELMLGAQVVFSSLDRGQTWKVLSPDLTRNVKSTEGNSGGPVMLDQTGAEVFPDLASLAVSPKNGDVIWAGSADGLVHVTTDHGAHWTDVTPPALPQWAQISTIETSHTDAGSAYLSASRFMWDDFRPYVYKTTDYGAHWTQITQGLPKDQYVFVVRQDPRAPQVLFAGTRSTVYTSLDDGAHWMPLTLKLPGVQVRDLQVDARQGMLVAATHGRAFWALDNLALIEDLARNRSLSFTEPRLFAPEDAWLTHACGGSASGNAGDNPSCGATVYFTLPKSYNGHTASTLAFVDANGATIRSYSLHPKAKREEELTDEQREKSDANQVLAHTLAKDTAVSPGMNVFHWNMRYPAATDVTGFRPVFDDDFPDTGDGPTILPGEYKVVLRYGETAITEPLSVRLDPRFHPAEGDLAARLALQLKIRDTIDALDRAIGLAIDARSHLAPGRQSALDTELAKLIQFDVHSSEADSVVPTRLREQLGFLGNSLDGAYERPTAAESATYDQLNGEAQAGIAALQKLRRQ